MNRRRVAAFFLKRCTFSFWYRFVPKSKYFAIYLKRRSVTTFHHNDRNVARTVDQKSGTSRFFSAKRTENKFIFFSLYFLANYVLKRIFNSLSWVIYGMTVSIVRGAGASQLLGLFSKALPYTSLFGRMWYFTLGQLLLIIDTLNNTYL